MNDSELRGHVLSFFYGRRREGFVMPQPGDFSLPSSVEWTDVLRICEQLGEQGLIEWKSQNLIGETYSNGFGKIVSRGVDVIENLTHRADRTVTYDNRQYVFHGSHNNIVGDSNVGSGGA